MQSRIRTIDAGRGTAMIFVFLAHFLEYYLTSNSMVSQFWIIWMVIKIASPTFMLISGITLGYLFSLKKDNFSSIKRKFIDKGMFLILIAHIVILLTWLPFLGSFAHGSLRVLFITDTIGICLIAGPFLVRLLSPSTRIMAAILIYGVSWLFVTQGNFENIFLEAITETFFGNGPSFYFDCFPVFPWLSIYFVGTVIGERVHFYNHRGIKGGISKLFFKLGVASLFISLIIKILFHFLKSSDSLFRSDSIERFLNFSQKNPPGLLYFLIYGGAGLVILAILDKLIELKLFNKIIQNLEIIGKTSLFAFVIQYFMYFSVMVWINPSYSVVWPLLFFFTAFLNFGAIYFWYKRGFNKYITVLDISILRRSKIESKAEVVEMNNSKGELVGQNH